MLWPLDFRPSLARTALRKSILALAGNYDLLFSLGARIVSVGGLLAVSVISARALGPAERGYYFLVVAYAQLAGQFGTLGLHSANTFYCADRLRRGNALLVQALVVSSLLSPLVALAISVPLGWPSLLGWHQRSMGSIGPVALLSVVLAPLTGAFLLISNMAVTLGRVKLFNLMIIGNAALAVMAAVVALGFGGHLISFLTAAILATAASNLISLYLLTYGAAFRIEVKWRLLRACVGYGLRAFLATLSAFGMSRVGAISMQLTGHVDAVGYYSVAQQIGDALSLVPSTVGLLVFPRLVRGGSEREKWALTISTVLGTSSVMVVLLLAAALLARPLIVLLFGAEYAPAAVLTVYLLPSVFFVGVASVVSQYLSAVGFPWSQVAVWSVAFPLMAVLSYMCARESGVVAILITQAAIYGAVACALFGLAYARARTVIGT